MNMRHSNGWLRKTGSVRPGFTVGRKLENMVKAVNHTGYEVQELHQGKGWIPAIDEVVGYTADDKSITKPMILADEEQARGIMAEIKKFPGNQNKEFRVYEAVEFPVVKK